MSNGPKIIKRIADAFAISLLCLIVFSLVGLTGLFSSIQLGLGETVSESNVFTSDQVSELEIELFTADITVLKGETLQIDSTKNCFRVHNRNGKLTLEEKNALFSRDESRHVTICIPEDFTFRKVEIDTGAGNINAEALKTEYLELDVGAGFVTFDNLDVTKKADIDCGAGTFTAKNGLLHNLDFSLGVGKADISAKLLANADIESGVGELKLLLLGGKETYPLAIEKGLGIFTVDSEFVKETVIGSGENKVKIEGGIGNINVSFA